MASFSTISIRFNADLKQFSSQMQNAQRELQKFGRQMQRTGKNMSIGITAPVLALGYAFSEAFDKQAKAIAQVEAGLRSTGNAVGYTSEQLQDMASEMQNNSLFGDEEILQGATAQLLTFTNIAGEQFARTQKASLDLATRLDGDLKSASIQLGKALNDPVANLSALSRSGIQFSKEQKEVINTLVATNRLADAQTIILDELEKQYGGAAEAAAKAGLGPFTQFKNIVGDIGEQFGEIIVNGLKPLIAVLKDAALRFQNTSPEVKKVIVVVAALAAAIGPLLVILGTMATTVLPALATGFTILTGPIGLVVAAIAAIGYVFYKYWDDIKKAVFDLANYFIDLYNESVEFRVAVKTIIMIFQAMKRVVSFVFDAILRYIELVGRYIRDVVSGLGDLFKAIITGDFKRIPQIIADGMQKTQGNFKKFFNDVKGDAGQMMDDISADIKKTMADTSKKAKLVIEPEVKQAKQAIDLAGSGRANVSALDTSGLQQFAEIKPLETSPFDKILPKMNKQVAELTDIQMRMMENAVAFNEGFAQITEQTAETFVEGFASLVGSVAEGGFNMGSIYSLILDTFGNFAIQIGKMAIGIGIAVEGIKKALQSLAGPVAIAAGIALVALGTFAKNALASSVPQFAEGGIVSGTTLGIMGEYAGARTNPEVIAPLDKLKGMLGDVGGGEPGGFVAETKLRGQDLIVAVKRADAYKNRRG